MTEHRIPEDIFQPVIENNGALKSVLVLTGDNTEDLEFFYPYYRFIEEGFQTDVATINGGTFKGKHGSGLQYTKKLADCSVENYDLLYIPGGKAPAKLKKSEAVLQFTREFFETGKPIAALCHGPQVLAAAGVIMGRRMAGWPEIAEEIEQGGGFFVSSETVVDGQFISGRWPADLPSFTAKVVEVLKSGLPVLTDKQPTIEKASRLQ